MLHSITFVVKLGINFPFNLPRNHSKTHLQGSVLASTVGGNSLKTHFAYLLTAMADALSQITTFGDQFSKIGIGGNFICK
jgi:hypothetical protein